MIRSFIVLTLALLASCKAVSSFGTAGVDLGHANEPQAPGDRMVAATTPLGALRYDGDTFIAIGSISAAAFLRTKGENPVYLAGPVGVDEGKVLIYSKSHDQKLKLDIGQPWPSWVKSTGLFTVAELRGLHITFDDGTVP